MAVVNDTSTEVSTLYGKGSLATWTALATGDTGKPIVGIGLSDRSFQASGTFGGATVILQGSNNGTDWVTLTDPAGAAISFTSTGLKQVLQVTKYMRPSVSGGAAVAINCDLLLVGKK